MAKFLPVVSAALTAIKFDRSTRKLYVQFAEDVFYEYSDIPNDTILDVMFADSLGGKFDELVKKGGFKFRKVTGVQANA